MAGYKLDISCSPYNSSDRRNIRICIKCLPITEGMDTAIFAYRRINNAFIFDHVCSTVDMAEYDVVDITNIESKILNGESFKWFRADVVDIIVSTLSIADDFIREVESDVNLLVRNMEAHNNLVGTEEIYITTESENNAAIRKFIVQLVNDEVTGPITVSYTDLVLTPWLNSDLLWTMGITTEGTNHGTIEKVDATTIRYTPVAGYSGDDDFDYYVTDGKHITTIRCTIYNINTPEEEND